MQPIRRALGVSLLAAVLAVACATSPVPEPSGAAASSVAVASPSVEPATPARVDTPSASSPVASAAPATAAPSSTSSPAPIAPAVASAIVPGTVDRTSLRIRATYDVKVILSFGTRSFATRTALTITNTSGGPIDRVELNTIAARLGSMRLHTVTVDGRTVRATVSDQTIRVPLGGILPDGATARLVVPYAARLRSSIAGSSWMFTKANGIVSVHRWIPWISRATPFDRPNHGDPFVTPVSPRVDVRVTADRSLVIAGTGGARTSISADRRVQTFRAEQVRDFVFSAAPDYRFHDATVGRHVVRVAARPGAPWSTMLSAAKNALAKLEARLGPYPYRMFTVAQSAGGFGMEGPATVWIPFGVPTANLRYLVTHETAHQWFYGIVGNDQARQPFADEAAADFVARFILGQRRASRCATAALDRAIYDYSTACYYEVVYIQGGNLLETLRLRMGDTAFWRALKGYVADQRFRLASTRQLLDALDAGTPLSFGATYRQRFPRLY